MVSLPVSTVDWTGSAMTCCRWVEVIVPSENDEPVPRDPIPRARRQMIGLPPVTPMLAPET
jgi:hypothetical protein